MIETWFNRPERSYNTENHYNLVLLNRTAIYLDVFLLTQESSWYICLVAMPTNCMLRQICRHILSPSSRYSKRVDDIYVSFSSHLLNTLLLFTLRKKHNFFWNWKNSNLKFFSHLLKKLVWQKFFEFALNSSIEKIMQKNISFTSSFHYGFYVENYILTIVTLFVTKPNIKIKQFPNSEFFFYACLSVCLSVCLTDCLSV